jgi:sterol desaturase/sphingolipid hydroxylase (fatty acid hydroxylase superfamily)
VTSTAAFQQVPSTIAGILLLMAALALLEAGVPLHARSRWHRAHLAPNLALTFLTFVTNAVLGAALLGAIALFDARGWGLLPRLGLPPLGAAALAVVGLDLAFYLAHVAMHRSAFLWRFHCVHHSDPAVDVTTTLRQHPGEGLIRYAFLAPFALALGVSPVAFAVYRTASALNALLEHANLRAPRGLDRALALVTTWPHMHKVHHSRRMEESNTNYGNLLSAFDRLFGTFTPSARGRDVAYGVAGLDDAATQTTRGLLAVPFRAASDGVGEALASAR